MIEFLFEEFPSRQNDRSDGAGESRNPPDDQNHREAELLAVLPVVRKIVGRRTLPALTSDAADVIQSVALRLWKWRQKYRDKSRELSPGEWESFAARTAYNEINRHFPVKFCSGRSLSMRRHLPRAARRSKGRRKRKFLHLQNGLGSRFASFRCGSAEPCCSTPRS